jgi:cation diffusion facilitator family transporter
LLNLSGPDPRSAQKGAWLSMAAYLVLSLLKCWTGLHIQSEAMFADGLNNVSDLLLSFAILIGLKVSQQPADHNHPFGHRKAETIATLVAASFMVLVAVEIWVRALQALWRPPQNEAHPWAFAVSIGSALIMFGVSYVNFSLSKKTGSQALEAAACDNRSDGLVSLGTAVGMAGAYWGWHWMDPLLAVVVGGMIFKTGWEIGRPAVDELMDGFDQEKLEKIEQQVLKISGIDQVRELRARYHGPYVFVEITIAVNPFLSVEESHEITEKVEKQLIGFDNIRHVHVHVEPAGELKKCIRSL